MADKLAGTGSKLMAVIFTGLVAPAVVEIAEKVFHVEESSPVRRQSPSQQEETSRREDRYPTPIPPAPPTSSRATTSRVVPITTSACTQVIATGVGKSPQEAVHDAIRTALTQAIAAQVEDATWAKYRDVILTDALRNNVGLIRGWRELKGSHQWKLGGSVHHQEVVVDIDRQAVRDRLRTLQIVF